MSGNGLESGSLLPSNGVMYASVLRLLAGSLVRGSSAMASKKNEPNADENNGHCPMGNRGSSDESMKVGGVEGALWAIRPQLSGY